MRASKNEDIVIDIESVGDLSPHNKALYEAGKKLLIDSLDVGRDFCKFMTTTTLGAIPTYLALLKFMMPKDYVLSSNADLVMLLPPALFLVSSFFFVLGLFPEKSAVSLDIVEDIERERRNTIQRRYRYSAAGFVIFSVGVALGAWLLVVKLMS